LWSSVCFLFWMLWLWSSFSASLFCHRNGNVLLFIQLSSTIQARLTTVYHANPTTTVP
jgi:hypothetical protein